MMDTAWSKVKCLYTTHGAVFEYRHALGIGDDVVGCGADLRGDVVYTVLWCADAKAKARIKARMARIDWQKFDKLVADNTLSHRRRITAIRTQV